MRNDLDHLLEAEQERISHLPSDQLPVLTSAAQTRLSWARTVDGFEALPRVYHELMAALLGAGRPFPYAVLTPTFAGFTRREKENLVFSLDDQIYIVERDGSRLNVTSYAPVDLNYVEVGAILLKAWIRLSGVSSDGVLASTTLKFNAVTDRLFTPFLQQIRTVIDPSPVVDREAELSKFDYLMVPSFKFMNYARCSVQPGVRVIDSLLQPEMRRQLLTLFGRTLSRLAATAHLCILTDTELIIIRDDEDSPVWKPGVRHGGVWMYLPLDKITTVSLSVRNAEVLALTIGLPHGDRVESLFDAGQRYEVDRFLSQLLEWAPYATLQREGFNA